MNLPDHPSTDPTVDTANCPIIVCEAAITDYDAVFAIYSYYIEHSNNNWRYQPKPFDQFKTDLDEYKLTGRPAFVAKQNNRIVGYGALHDFRSADGYWPCVENSIYVHPNVRGFGIGSLLMNALIDQANSCRLWSIIAAIDSANEGSIRFHERFGFKICGRLNNIGEKGHQALSAVFMQLDIPENRNRFFNG
jgi:L-amino acid N-acyltransferase YncA